MDGEATQIEVKIDIQALHGVQRRPGLRGKGYLIHVEAETKTTDAVGSADGRKPRDASTSLYCTLTRLF